MDKVRHLSAVLFILVLTFACSGYAEEAEHKTTFHTVKLLPVHGSYGKKDCLVTLGFGWADYIKGWESPAVFDSEGNKIGLLEPVFRFSYYSIYNVIKACDDKQACVAIDVADRRSTLEHHRKWQIHRFALEKVIHLKANEKRVVDGRYLDMPAASFEGLRFAKQMELNTRGFELKFNLIPPGLVYFGRPPGRRGLNPRVHQSKPFWMMETELTADVLKAYRDAHGTPYEGELLIKSEEKDWRRVYAGQELSLIAATHLIKKEAMQIADWLAEDLPAGFKSKGSLEFRVPTTAEYVHAAHGNAETAWYWGDDISGAYEHEAMSLSGGHYVKRADANPFGLYDMYGNAPEVLLDNCFMDPRTWNDAWDFCGRLSEKGGRCNGGSIAIGGVTSEELIGGFGPGLRKVDPHWYIGCRYVLSPHRFVEMRGKE